MTPAIIEVALNGSSSKARNPHTPVTPEEIVADALRCIAAGAQSVHNHEPTASRYLEAWEAIHAAKPDVLLCPTVGMGETIAQRFAHMEPLARSGVVKLGPLDPGSVNLSGSSEDGLPSPRSLVYSHSYADCAYVLEQFDRCGLAASISVFDGSFLRAALAFHRAGKLRRGALIKLYFGGDYSFLDGRRGLSFGLPPTRKALEAYLEMLDGTNLPWAVNVYGGDVTACGLARMALEMGGHVRVGLEDFAGDRQPSNLQLVEEVVELAHKVGRPLADCKTAAEIIGIAA
jgi:uncharacterized protein (DUF849 family)